MAERTGQLPGSGPGETSSARGRFVVAGMAAGMAASQVPVPERSVPLGRVMVSGPPPDVAGEGACTSGKGKDGAGVASYDGGRVAWRRAL